jgi:hypothetical protein
LSARRTVAAKRKAKVLPDPVLQLAERAAALLQERVEAHEPYEETQWNNLEDVRRQDKEALEQLLLGRAIEVEDEWDERGRDYNSEYEVEVRDDLLKEILEKDLNASSRK